MFQRFLCRSCPTITRLTSPLSSATTTMFPRGVRAYSTEKNPDYYKVLGVSKGANQDEIKKAYRRKAMEKHPDQGGSSDEFAQINAAYEVLSDPQKRQVYDQYGAEAANNPGGMGGGMHGMRTEDLFKDFFGGGMGGFGGAERQRPQTEDMAVSISATLQEIYKGVRKTIIIQRPTICSTCNGNGSTNPAAKKTCGTCKGSGQEVVINQVGPGMVQQFVTTCRTCKGQGYAMDKKDACTVCSGEGYSKREATVPVELNSSVFNGDVILMRGQAGCVPGGTPGDLHVQIDEKPHPTFTRRGFDLLITHELALAEALGGFQIPVSHLDGRVLTLKATTRDIVNTGSVLLVRGEGMPKTGGDKGKGNLYVTIKVKMPTSLSKEQKDKLMELLNYTPPPPPANVSATVTPDLVAITAEELLKSKKDDWERIESTTSYPHQKVSSSQYRGGGGGSRSRGRKGGGGGGGGQQQQCQPV